MPLRETSPTRSLTCCLLVALGELFFEVGEGEAHLLGEHEEVIEQVARFVEVALAIAVDGFDDGLDGLFAYLLGYLVHTLTKEVGGVGSFGHLGVAVLDAGLEGAEEAFVVAGVEARHGAAMAGGAVGADLDEEGVAIAVDVHVDHVEVVAAGLALGPQGLAGAAVEGDAALGLGLLEGFLVHVAEHQYLEAVGILYDDGKQSVGCLREIEILVGHILSCLNSYFYSFLVQGLLEHGDGYLAIVEDAGSEGCIGTSEGEHIGNVVDAARTA